MTIKEMSKLHKTLVKAVNDFKDNRYYIQEAHTFEDFTTMAKNFAKASAKLDELRTLMGLPNHVVSVGDLLNMANDEEAFVLCMFQYGKGEGNE